MIWLRLLIYTVITIMFLYSSGYWAREIVKKINKNDWFKFIVNSNTLFLGLLWHLFVSTFLYFILEFMHIVPSIGTSRTNAWKIILYLQLIINIPIFLSSFYIFWKKFNWKFKIEYIPLALFVIIYFIISNANPVYFFNNGALDNWLYVDKYSSALMLNDFGLHYLPKDNIINMSTYLKPTKHIFNFGVQSSIFFANFTNLLFIKKMYFIKTFLFFSFATVTKIIFAQEIVSLFKKIKISIWPMILYPFIVPVVSVEMYKLMYLTFYPSVILVTIFVVKLFDAYYEMFIEKDRKIVTYLLIFLISTLLFHGNSMIMFGILVVGYLASFIKNITNKWVMLSIIITFTAISFVMNYVTTNYWHVPFSEALVKGEEFYKGMAMIRIRWYVIVAICLPIIYFREAGLRLILILSLVMFIVINTDFYRSILTQHTPLITPKGTYVYGRVIIGMSHFIPIIIIGAAFRKDDNLYKRLYILICWVPALIYMDPYYSDLKSPIYAERMWKTFYPSNITKYWPSHWLRDESIKANENLDKWVEEQKKQWGDSYTVVQGPYLEHDYNYYVSPSLNERTRVDLKYNKELNPILEQLENPSLERAPYYNYLVVRNEWKEIDFVRKFELFKGPFKETITQRVFEDSLPRITKFYKKIGTKVIKDNKENIKYTIFELKEKKVVK